MDKNNKKTLLEFEKQFEENEVELLVLTKSEVKGAAVYDNMLKPSVEFISSVNVKTKVFSNQKGRLEWMIENKQDGNSWGFEISGLTIYHVKARKCFSRELEPYMSEIMNNRYLLKEIIKEEVKHSKLDEIKLEYSKPVFIEDDILGKFILDRSLSIFEGKINYFENECYVSLDTDEDEGTTANKAFEILKEIYSDINNWNDKFCSFAAEQLTSLANDWQDEEYDEDDDKPKEITTNEFKNRISLSELVIRSDGDITVYYNDDDMFWGHAIEVSGNISGEFFDANIVG